MLTNRVAIRPSCISDLRSADLPAPSRPSREAASCLSCPPLRMRLRSICRCPHRRRCSWPPVKLNPLNQPANEPPAAVETPAASRMSYLRWKLPPHWQLFGATTGRPRRSRLPRPPRAPPATLVSTSALAGYHPRHRFLRCLRPLPRAACPPAPARPSLIRSSKSRRWRTFRDANGAVSGGSYTPLPACSQFGAGPRDSSIRPRTACSRRCSTRSPGLICSTSTHIFPRLIPT